MQARMNMRHTPKQRFEPWRCAAPIAALPLIAEAFASFQKPGKFSVALGKKLRCESPETVDLFTVVAHPWDELFTLGPYADGDLNGSKLQLGWFGCRRTCVVTRAGGIPDGKPWTDRRSACEDAGNVAVGR